MLRSSLRHRHLCVNGVTLHVVTAGPEGAPAVLLLHGFPELWAAWLPYVDALVEAGFGVIVPDQRGYGESEKPWAVGAYAIDELSRDVLGLLDALGVERAALVGHDWGAAVAWWTAMRAPERTRRLVAINVPHPMVLRTALARSPEQLGRSWYMFFFQLPYLPERLFGLEGGRRMLKLLRATGRPGTFGAEHEAALLEAWARPGAARGMLNWYRAARAMLAAEPPEDPRIRVRTLILWGARDRMLGRELAEQSLALCDDGRLRWFEDATHWVTHEEVPAVTAELLAFLAP
jgi:pimeloyl-ACP methyl ester carboxylesterase